MKMHNAQAVVIGQVVSTVLYNRGRGVVFAVHGEQRPASVGSLSGCVSYGGNATFDIAFESGGISRGLPESILHGKQWIIFPEIKIGEETARIVKYAESEERRKEQEKEEAECLYAAECERLKTAPEYAALSQDKNGAVQVTSNIRKELKARFAGVKFSVRKRSYDSVSVNWMDGPTEEEVKAVTDKYKDSYFDGMQDMSVSCASPFNRIYGGVGYVFTDRDYSDGMKEKAVNMIAKKYGGSLEGEEITLARFNSGDLYRVGRDYFWHNQGVQGEINRTLEGIK
ncbi:LPD29 domain-containing protein (plasmid) [Pantoea agglomerans]|uniref:LPD29 domain-containing protein n=1 Tax=Enterobacter agglomerans TaxID=549 RepID=UPI0028A2C33C|nr:LPD29 domain-containing protein [Pantoea agglomerans]WNK51204.1 LPD29 domain-containing protein [Pantoea agglomerans]